MYEEYLLFLEMDTSFFSNCFYLQYRRFLKLVLINLLTVYFVQSIFYYRVFNLMGGQYPLNREKFMLKITLIKGKIIVRVTIFSRKSASCCVIFYSPSFFSNQELVYVTNIFDAGRSPSHILLFCMSEIFLVI